MWFNLLLLVISFVGTWLLSSKPKTEQQRPGALNDINFPHATDGSPIPMLLGRTRQNGPNTLWYGDFKSSAVYKKVKSGILSSTKAFNGYKYYLGFHLGLCMGPNAILRRMWIDKEVVYTGATSGTTLINIDKEKLFGGDDSGGGWVGSMRWYDGAWSQAQNAYLVGLLTDVPAYRGTAHLVFEHVYIGKSNNLRQLGFEVERHTDSLGLGSHAVIGGADLNPMEALFHMLTDPWEGAGLNADKVDTASFLAAGQTLYAESNGVSGVVANANQVADGIKEIIRQADVALYEEPSTGKLAAKLIRNDYDIATLPVFNESSIATVRNFTRTMWTETLNECRVTFPDRGADYAQSTAVAQDMANIGQQGRVRSQTVSFPWCCDASLANSLAARELARLNVPLFKCELEMNRTAAGLRPGSVFVLAWAAYGIVQAVMRVQKINLGSLEDGRIVVTAVQDSFSASDAVFAAPPSSAPGALSRDPVAITSGLRDWVEAPYWLMQHQTAIAAPAAGNAWTLGVAREPNAAQSAFTLYTDTASGFTAPSADIDHGAFANTALLKTSLAWTTGHAAGTATVDIENLNPSGFTLATVSDADAQAGKSLFLIGAELFSYTTVVNHGDGSYTLTARRALLDTEFADHAALATVFFIDEAAQIGATTFTGSATIYGKFASSTDRGEYDVSGETPITLALNQRYDRPLPPDLPMFDAAILPATVTTTGPHTISWLERCRTDAARFEFTQFVAV